MTSNKAAEQPSSTGNQSAQVDLLPRPTTLDHYSSSFQNKQPMEMLSSPKDQTSKLQVGIEPLPRIQNQSSSNVGISFPLASNKQQAQMGSLQKLQTKLPVIAGLQHSVMNKRPVKTEVLSVRSKLRESLTSALAAGSDEQNKIKFPEKNPIGEEKCLFKQTDGSLCESLPDYLNSDGKVTKFAGNQGLPSDVGSSGNFGDKKALGGICNVQEGHGKHDIVMDDVLSHSFMEDELLQGHGLCWASDFDSVNADSMLNSTLKRPKLMDVEENRDTKDTLLQTSEKLSVLIEAELFKLFGGVNKKYKERGRSLLFNLKDPNNPELRERVLSGDLSPERLCSMTAEDLASKELSQWRQAKAEEFEHMVVLPDMDIDVRRLVKKTHKGEFQVEVDQDDGAHVEVGLGSDVLSKMLTKSIDVDQSQPRSNDQGLSLSRTSDFQQGDKSDSDGRNVSSSLAHRLPEKPDYIQDFMVEELKDTEFLPSVVSLDEFMQALDSEPPFENLEDNDLQENPTSVDRNLDRLESESIHPNDSSGHNTDIITNKLDSKLHSGHIHTKHIKEISSSNSVQVDYTKHVPDSKSNIIWEGFIQLNVSALSNVVSFFLSGERTSMQEWPSLLEVKGRVRLDAFEKFLQELPLSRSRTIMVVEFNWKENSVESGRVHLSEAINSYVTDERLGFAEPVPGVELYLCPSHPKITSILSNHLSKEILESIDSVVNGLIGIIVWRRPHAIISPKGSSHRRHKHGGSKQHSGLKRRQDGTNFSSHRNPMPPPDDDVPPGFGPRISRDDDDLPEFDFSRAQSSRRASAAMVGGGRAMPVPAPAPASARELIQKYGQGESTIRDLGIPVQPWNDDDDIPEWNPNQNTKMMPQPMPPPPPSQLHMYQQQMRNSQPFPMNQNSMPPQFIPTPLPPPSQTQGRGMQPNNAMWRPAARGMPDSSLRPCHIGGQMSGERPLGPGVGPRMFQGFGGVRNGLGFWRPDNNNSGSKGL